MSVARECGLDERTIRDILEDFAIEKEKTHVFRTPTVVGIEEIHLDEVGCVLVDVADRKIYDILSSRTKYNVAADLREMKDKERVEVVAADMWLAYHDLAVESFPGSLVVVDKFHVLRMAHNGLNEVRKACGRQRTQEERIKLKDERHLLHHRREKLNDHQREKVEVWLRAFPLLRQAYNAEERITDAYDAPSRREGERAMLRCIQRIPPEIDMAFGEMTTAFENWKKPIWNDFEVPVTNACTESVNAIIRELDRVGRGYRFRTMRALMLFDEQARSSRTSTRARRPGIPDGTVGFIGAGSMGGPWSFAKVESQRDEASNIKRLLARLALEPTVGGDEEDE